MLRYGFFDSEITGYDEEGMPIFDRAESSDFLAIFISKIISDGVLALPGDCFQVVAFDKMTVRVRPGFGIVKGRFAADDKESEVTLADAPSAYKRIDRIVLRVNHLQRRCEIILKTGTPDATPQPPELIRPEAGDYYELCLAEISINSNQTVITQANIKDTRYDSTVCGIITQVIDHLDTSVFYAQLEQFYSEFVDRSEKSFADFVVQIQQYVTSLKESGNMQLHEILQTLLQYEQDAEGQFYEWFVRIRGQLSEDAAGNLQNQLNDLKGWRFIDGYLRAPYGGVGMDNGYLIAEEFEGGK